MAEFARVSRRRHNASMGEREGAEPASAPAEHVGWARRLARLVPGLLVIAVITVIAVAINRIWPLVSALLVAIVLGALVANVVRMPASWQPGIDFAAKKLLRFGIILLGLQISIDTLIGLGWQRLVLVVAVVAIGVASTLLLGRLLGIGPRLTALIASGFSICGAAAVAGAKDVVGARDSETGTALALVVVYGTLAIPIVPWLAGMLGFGTAGSATLVGASVHEVAQVVAAATALGEDALATAVTIKLARVVCLAAVLAVLSIMARRGAFGEAPDGAGDAPGRDGTKSRTPLIPGFVLGFLAMVVLGSLVDLPSSLLSAASTLQTAALAMAMTALGFGIRIRELRKVGFKPVLLGLLATLVVTTVAATGVVLIGE